MEAQKIRPHYKLLRGPLKEAPLQQITISILQAAHLISRRRPKEECSSQWLISDSIALRQIKGEPEPKERRRGRVHRSSAAGAAISGMVLYWGERIVFQPDFQVAPK